MMTIVWPPAVQPSEGDRALICGTRVCGYRPARSGGRGRLSICTWPGLVVELTFCAVDSPDLPAVFAVVVDEHVLADTQEGGGVHLEEGEG